MKKEKGFTLIELLAVIVILAIIALIATPIVLNIINDSKESATLQSAKFYLDSVQYTIADAILNDGGLDSGKYPITPDGNICKTELPCTDENTLKVEIKGQKPTSGYINIQSSKIENIELGYNDKIITKNNDDKLVYLEPLLEPCKNITGDKDTPGSIYECEVKHGTKYNFYVLSTEADGTTNLIMDRNICSDGTATDATKSDKCYVSYTSSENFIGDGPVTAMEYLNQATSTWRNIPNLDITYDDEGTNFENFKITGKARMPYLHEVEDFDAEKNNGYLYENLDDVFSSYEETINYYISEILGYWTLSSDSANSYFAVSSFLDDRNVFSMETNVDNLGYGVRPVINIKL